MRMDELVARILGWANDRNLVLGSTVEKQYVKLVEEFGEYAAGLARGKLDVQADALGDMMVITVIMGAQADVGLLRYMCQIAEADDIGYDSAVLAIKRNMEPTTVQLAFLQQAQCIGGLGGGIADYLDLTEGLAVIFGNAVATCFVLGLEPTKVLEDVWNIIKDRKGKMVDGVFVKEGDAMMAGGGNSQ